MWKDRFRQEVLGKQSAKICTWRFRVTGPAAGTSVRDVIWDVHYSEYYLNIACNSAKICEIIACDYHATWWHAKCLIHLGGKFGSKFHGNVTIEKSPQKGGKEWMNLAIWRKSKLMKCCVFFGQIQYTVNLDLPKGAKWLLKGVNSPSLRV